MRRLTFSEFPKTRVAFIEKWNSDRVVRSRAMNMGFNVWRRRDDPRRRLGHQLSRQLEGADAPAVGGPADRQAAPVAQRVGQGGGQVLRRPGRRLGERRLHRAVEVTPSDTDADGRKPSAFFDIADKEKTLC